MRAQSGSEARINRVRSGRWTSTKSESLDAYLKKLFGNAKIRVVPKTYDTAEVFVGDDDAGELNLDDEDGDKSYNFRMVIQVGQDPTMQPVPTLKRLPAAQIRE